MPKDDNLLDKASKMGSLYSAIKLREIKEEQERTRKIQELQLKQQENLLREQKRIARQQSIELKEQRENALNDEKERAEREETQELTKYLRTLNLEIISNPETAKRKLDSFFIDPLFLKKQRTTGLLILDNFVNLTEQYLEYMVKKVLSEAGINEINNTSSDSLNSSLDHLLSDTTGFEILANLHLGPKLWTDGLYRAKGLFLEAISNEEHFQDPLAELEALAAGTIKSNNSESIDNYISLVNDFDNTISALSQPPQIYYTVIQHIKRNPLCSHESSILKIVDTHFSRIQFILHKAKESLEEQITKMNKEAQEKKNSEDIKEANLAEYNAALKVYNGKTKELSWIIGIIGFCIGVWFWYQRPFFMMGTPGESASFVARLLVSFIAGGEILGGIVGWLMGWIAKKIYKSLTPPPMKPN